MASDCCKLVGSLNLNSDGCITSIQVQSSTEISKIGSTIIQGSTFGTVNITGYASLDIHVGCGGKASASIDWVRKYDCDNDQVYILFSGAGRSSIAGDVGGFAELGTSLSDSTYDILNASSANGPSALYEEYTQTDGFGLNYSGGPISFTADDTGPVVKSIGKYSSLCLQSFSLQCTPGALSVATYSFIYLPNGGIVG